VLSTIFFILFNNLLSIHIHKCGEKLGGLANAVDSLLELVSLQTTDIFTALNGMQTRSYDEISVRLSVRLSVCPSVRLSVCLSNARM